MSRRWLLSLLCLAILFLSVTQFTRARGELRVDETNSSILLEKDPAEVLLAVENPAAANVTAKIQLELLDPRNTPVAKATELQTIARGGQKLRLSLPFAFPSSGQAARKQILWYRLHYRLSPHDSPDETLAEGVISLSEMTPDLFELRVAAAEVVREGKYRVRIQAVHPLTERPSANVRVEGHIAIEDESDEQAELTGSASTDDKGHAMLDFNLPARFPKHPHRVWATGELHLTGKKGAIVVQTTGEVRLEQFARVLITTDKPLYQPGQVMHLRALMLTASNQALANYETFFKICDPEGAILYRTVETTSRFGIASTDWTIPENTRLGDYQIWVGIDGGDNETGQQVRISRYELPNFRVNVDLDQKFYLPGQNATATVKADYLFGQPVLRGKVRVVRESDRRWNYREQKWEVDEENEQKGETNADGSFVAQLDLKSAHQELADEYDDRRFKDITYAAYITDPTTNRTEQRRFDVRVTTDPVHVYVLEAYNWSYSSQLPVKFYVSTFYADGSPARCNVNVSFTDEPDDDTAKKHVTTVTTNRYGLAKISTRLPDAFEDIEVVDVVVSASDSSGRKGSAKEELRFDDQPRVLVETDKTIYRPGEPIKAVITGNDQVKTVIVDLAGEGGLIRSERLKLNHGRASISFPFKRQFKNGLNVVAYPEGTTSRSTVAMRTVLYPHNTELNVDVRSSQDTYRPGENAELRFNVQSATDVSEESALGVVVMDQAVLDRFRTDQEFGGSAYGYGNALKEFLGFADNFAGITMRDLRRLDTSRPVPPDLDTVAAVVVRNMVNYFPAFYSDDEFEDDAADVFAEELKKQLKPLKEALDVNYTRTMEYPKNEAELSASLSQAKIDFSKVRDPWGMPYHPEFYVEKQNDTVAFWSSGADKRYDTDDDFFVEQVSWPYFRHTGETIDRAVMRHHQQSGKFIRDAATLRDEISIDGLNLDQMHDRWGRPYRLEFEVEESHFVLEIRSGGPDKQFAKDPRYLEDDFIIWKSAIDYFAEPREQITTALTENFNRTKTFPQSDQQLRQALGGFADTFNNLRDPWGNAYYATFKAQTISTDNVQVENRANFSQPTTLRTNITPVTKTFGIAVLHSTGPDKQKGTGDDFVMATFTGVISEQPQGAAAPIVPISLVVAGNNGGIAGIVTDPMGA
ncbi:MAG TPA: MG2 domain-containing protein, partial [Pyrinomonadaceae bacterium]|nr:MG2 domain-containing protein [Pyrinomonadaceae bacterium]